TSSAEPSRYAARQNTSEERGRSAAAAASAVTRSAAAAAANDSQPTRRLCQCETSAQSLAVDARARPPRVGRPGRERALRLPRGPRRPLRRGVARALALELLVARPVAGGARALRRVAGDAVAVP